MKRLNIKLLSILAIALVIMMSGVMVVHAIQMNRNIDSLIKRAEDTKKTDPATAVWLYQRYRSYKPDDQERNADFAMLLADEAQATGDERQYFDAVESLQRAIDSTENRPELRRKRIELNMTFHQFKSAMDDLKQLKDKGQSDAHNDLQLAQCYISLSRYLDAAKLLELLVGYDSATKEFNSSKATAPHELDAYFVLATLLRDKITDAEMSGHDELANRVMDQLVTVNQDSAKAFLLQAQYLTDPKAHDRALAAIQKAQELAPDDTQVLLLSVQMALIANDFAGAEKWVDKGLKLYPKDERFYRLWAAIAQQQKNLDEAKRRLDEGLKTLPSSISLLDLYFDLQLQKNDYEGARLTLKKLASARLRTEFQELYAARLAIAEGKYREARQQLEQLRLGLTKIPQLASRVDQLLLQCYGALNQPDLALKVATNLQGTPEGELGMAASLATLGKTSEALKHYERIASILEQQNKLTAVPQVMRAILELRIAEVLRKPKDQRDWKSIDALVAKMRDQNLLKEPTVSLLQISILARKGEDEKAHQSIQELLKQYPADSSVVGAAVNFALQQRHPDEALRIINAAPEDMQSQPRFMVNRLEALFIAGGSPEELKTGLAAIARDIEKLPKEQRIQLYPNLGSSYIHAGDYESAKQLWNRAAEESPRDPQIRLLQFDLARDMGDMATMKQIQQWFEKEYTDDPVQTKLLEAAVMISTVQQELRDKQAATPQQQVSLDDSESRSLLRARDLLQEVNNLRPGWVEQPKWLAQIDMLEGKTDEAIEDLHQVLELGQPNTEVVKTLVRLLHSRHRNAEASEILEANSPLVAGDAEMDQIQAQLDLANGQPKAALERMKNRFSDDSTNPNQHLLHGELLAGAGDNEQAEKELRRALELSPELAGAWIDLIRLKVIEKKPEDALQVLQEAQIKLPEDQRALVLAQGYEFLNDQTEAEQNFLAALSASPKSLPLLQQVAEYYMRTNRPSQAAKYLNEILTANPTQPGDKDSYAWARRTTAQLMAGGNYQQFLKSLELLTPAGEKPNLEDLTTRISILFEHSDPASSRQALRLLGELKQMRPLTWQERLILAKLNERIDDWPAAREGMLSLLAQPKPDPIIYATFIKMLLRHGAADEALTWLQQLESLGNQNKVELTFLAADALNVLGSGSQAAAQLVRLLPTERPLPKEQWPLLRQVANELEQIGQFDQAEKLIREDVGYEPQQTPMLAAFYARRGKVDAALNLLEQNRKSISTPIMLQIAMAALRQGINPPTQAQIERVEQWFDRALREDPDSWVLQMELSDLRDFQRRYDDAEKLYRALLSRSDLPKNQRALVLNNLAFMLAMQGRNRDEAIQLIDEAVSSFGPQSDMLDTRGVVYLSKGDVQQALADLSDAVIATEPKPIQFVHLAMAQAKAKDETGARKSLERAKQLKFNADDLSPLEKSQYQALLKQLNIAA
jgi:tetratricopeptide (TPR) repeat protein/lipopolysaccharide biosynthesis regulator YciM